MNVLVVQTAFLGDLLLSIPLLKYLRKKNPNACLILYCRKGFGDTFVTLKLVDRVIEIDKASKSSWAVSRESLAQALYEQVVCVHESFRTALTIYSLKSPIKIGFKNWWNFWALTHRVARPMDYPEALRQLMLMVSVDSELKTELEKNQSIEALHNESSGSPIDRMTAVPVNHSMNVVPNLPAEALAKAKVTIPWDKPVVFLAPGSLWPTKKWGGYLALGQMLAKDGHKVVLIGSESEQEENASICAEIPNAVNMSGQSSIVETLCLLSLGKGLIANDSGAMHLAAAVDLPTVAIFGPTTLKLGYRPWQNQAMVIQKDLGCRPCGKHGAKKCPIGTHECMKAVTSLEVFLGFKQLAD